MARTHTPQASAWRVRLPFLFATGLLVIFSIAALAYFLSMNRATGGTSPVTVTLKTESGSGTGVEGTVDTPLTISARVLRSNGDPETLLVSASVTMLDSSGRPAEYGGKPQDPSPLKAGSEVGTWVVGVSVPSAPGEYHPRLDWVVLPEDPQAQNSVTNTLELKDVVLKAMPASRPPVTSGYVFARDSNLWIMSTDLAHQRRLTFFPAYYEYADNPAWSPDGKTIAFAYSPRVAANEIPATHIWTINPDDSGAKQMLAHSDGESVYEPAWSPDGKYLFFTAEQSSMTSTSYDATGAPVGEKRIDRLEVATGVRTQWAPAGQSLRCCAQSGELVYLEDNPNPDPSSEAAPGQRLVMTDMEGRNARALVDEKAFQMMYAPAISPDGKWVAFGAINVPPQKTGGFDIFRWLLFQPETAYAHGLPWDMFVVSTSGGQPIQLTNLSEDQPYAVWLDNDTLAFMGVRGLYKVQIDSEGKPAADAEKVHEGAPHGGLTWHAP